MKKTCIISALIHDPQKRLNSLFAIHIMSIQFGEEAHICSFPGDLILFVFKDQHANATFFRIDQASKRFRKVANANLAPNSPKGEIGPLLLYLLLFYYI